VALTVEQARAALVSRLGGPDARPALSDVEIDALMAQYAIMDLYERRPTDPAWQPTYALNAAAAEGWRQKAARVAADFNFGANGATYSKGEVMAKCLEMEAHYASLDTGTMPTQVRRDYPVRQLWL